MDEFHKATALKTVITRARIAKQNTTYKARLAGVNCKKKKEKFQSLIKHFKN
jgi:hypothetical protein